MDMFKYFSRIEDLIIKAIALIFPWSIVFATPQLHMGYWGQVESMIVFSHFVTGIVAILLLRIGIYNKDFRQYFSHPLVLLPSLIGIYSIISGLFQRLPIFAVYGSPQLGQGAFWYFSLSLLTLLYLYIFKNNRLRLLLFINFCLVILLVTIGSFYPLITGVQISFFGFNDWLALYFTTFIIFIISFLELYNFKIKKELLYFIAFLVLGPLFWKIDNNSASALWLLIVFAWIVWMVDFYYKKKIKFLNELIYNPVFFTLIPILLSVIMVFSSFMFWDGKTDMTDKITNYDTWVGHLSTLVARGSIVRVLFENLENLKVLLLGYGWGNISELLIKSFTPEVFYQINTGNRVHFHTHNELFEHIFSIGLVGAFIYISYIYNIFKYAFKISISLAFIWLLFFCIGAFWFTWISIVPIQAMLTTFLITSNSSDIKYIFSKKINYLFNSIYFYSSYLLLAAVFLFYGAYIGYFTAYNHESSFRSDALIEIAKESKKTGNCSGKIHDFGKGSLQYSQKLNGYSNYYKDQVMLYAVLNQTDYDVLEWHLCASNELIKNNTAYIELINVHVNVLSMISILPGRLGEDTRIKTKKYMDLWEEKLMLLLSLAPRRTDQATPLISYYLKNENDSDLSRLCNYFIKVKAEQGFCDLAMGANLIKQGQLSKGILLIKKARDLGVLDSEDVDPETSEYLKGLIEKY